MLESRQLSNHDQGPDTTHGTQREVNTCHIEHHLASRFLGGSWWLWLNTKKLSTLCEVLFLRAIGEEAEVANAHESIRKDVEQETTDELIRLKRQRSQSIGVSAIAIRESDATLIQREDAIVGYGDAVSVAGQVIENFVRDRERPLSIDNPLLDCERTSELVEGCRLSQRSTAPNVLKLIFGECSLEQVKELATEDRAECADGKEKPFASGIPMGAIERQRARWNQAVEMEVIAERLVPGVKHTDEPEQPAWMIALTSSLVKTDNREVLWFLRAHCRIDPLEENILPRPGEGDESGRLYPTAAFITRLFRPARAGDRR
jgi:hypothetical protein